jgi:MFS family permease
MSENETKKIFEYKEKRYMINKIELVYFHIKNETPYHKRLKWLIFFIVIIANSYLWNLMFNFSPIRQNIYQYNIRFKQMERISSKTLCNKYETKLNLILYDNRIILNNVSNFNDELIRVNKEYMEFFFENSMDLFSIYSNSTINISEPFYNEFNAAVVLTANERYNIYLKYNDICDQSNSLVMFSVFMMFGAVIGNFIISLIADIIGRKRVLVISLIVLFFSNAIFYILVLILDLEIKNKIEQYKDPNIIINKYEINKFTYETYDYYKIFFSICFFFIHLSVPGVKNTALTLFMENSLNDPLAYIYFIWYIFSLSISLFYSFVLNFYFEDFKQSYLINSGIIILFIICLLWKVGESPRFLFEMADWQGLTNFFYKYFDQDKLSNLSCSEEKYTLVKKFEENLLKERNSFIENETLTPPRANRGKRLSSFYFQIYLAKLYKKLISKNDNFIINQNDLKMNPLLIHVFLINDIHIRKNFSILIAMVIVIGFYCNSVNINFFSTDYMSRVELFQSTYPLKSIYLINVVVCFISIWIYYILLIFFGYKWVMIITSFFIMIFSILKDYNKAYLPTFLGDRTKYNYDLLSIYNSENNTEMVFFSVAMSIMINGLYYAFNIYLISFSKTIYRCTFIGIVQFIHTIGFCFSVVLNKYFPDFSLLISGLAAFIGIYPIIFTNDKNEGTNIISDGRKIDQIAQFLNK